MCWGCVPARSAAPGSWVWGYGTGHEEVHGVQVLLCVPVQEVALQEELQSQSPRESCTCWRTSVQSPRVACLDASDKWNPKISDALWLAPFTVFGNTFNVPNPIHAGISLSCNLWPHHESVKKSIDVGNVPMVWLLRNGAKNIFVGLFWGYSFSLPCENIQVWSCCVVRDSSTL